MIDLEKIAREYHLAPKSDMFIENKCQEFELAWVREIIPPLSKVLELGYGDGITFKNLSQYCDLTVVDGSELIVAKALETAQELGVQSKIYHSYFENFVSEEKFDYVFASHVMEHVEDPSLIVRRLEDWLKPGGKALIIVPNAESIHRRLAVLLGLQPELETLSARDKLVGHLRVFRLDELRALFANPGWIIEIERGFFLKPLANFQLEKFDHDLIGALCELSDELDARLCANLALVVSLGVDPKI
jgi:2-polyprenyl-3-methyl-5-hydroxy-6-metoxy-1,4-benzoquinol methylase